MKRSSYAILAALVLVLALSLCACDGGKGEDTESEAVYYTVKFDDGTTVTEQTVLENTAAVAPAEPQRDGYIFECWMSGGREWDPDSKVTADVTVTAHWINAATVYQRRNDADGEGVYITGYNDEYRTMKIPSSIDGVKVIGIDDGVFQDISSENVQRIIVPETVTYIGNNAFHGCSGIEVQIKGNLTFIGDYAFTDCDMLTQVGFGEGLVNIPPEAFSGCVSLKELRLPASLTLIDENAFEDCVGLVFVIMYDTMKTVGDGAFFGCDALKTVYFYGTEQTLDGISVADMNDNFIDAKFYYHASEKPSEDGDFWYIDSNGKIKLW